MKLYLIIFLLITKTSLSYVRKAQCHACFYETCYSRQTIFKQHRITGQIAVERGGNIVYFHYKDEHNIDHTSGFDLDDIRFLNVPDVEFSFARTVDQSTRDVYIGGEKGIYKYDPISNTTTAFGLTDKIIWHMHYIDKKIYYKEFMKNGLFTYTNKQTGIVTQLSDYNIEDFVIDKRGDVYFMSNFLIYKLKNSDSKPIVFSNVTFSLCTDRNDNVYLVQSASRAMYKINYRNGNLIEVGAFSNGTPVKVVFDNFNNVIYYDSDTNTLFYLMPNYGTCKVQTEGTGDNIKKIVSSTYTHQSTDRKTQQTQKSMSTITIRPSA